VAITIAVFLVVAASVVWRRTQGTSAARALIQLAGTRSELESQRLQLESDIVSETSLSRLGNRVQGKLGMHVPNDSAVILLPRPAARRGR
jgi:hypothetical protein